MISKRIITILGTRPEVIRLSEVIKKLDKFTNHKIIHTGQNFDYELDKIFFKELEVRKPDYFLNCKGSFASQIANIFKKLEIILLKEKPDSFLVLGDTNSSLGSIIAKRLGVKVFHMEAGNRSHNLESPEEVNRKLIDHSSDILMPYTSRSKENLIHEGFKLQNIFVIGNPIYEVIKKNNLKISKANFRNKNKIKKKKYILVTLHRQENVDDKNNLKKIFTELNLLTVNHNMNIIFPTHPRTRKNIVKNKIKISKKIKLIKPVGFFDFVDLEKHAFFVITDSGTVQEECAIFKTPVIIARDSTERPETIESGSAVVSGKKLNNVSALAKLQVLNSQNQDSIKDYQIADVSSKVIKIILSNHIY